MCTHLKRIGGVCVNHEVAGSGGRSRGGRWHVEIFIHHAAGGRISKICSCDFSACRMSASSSARLIIQPQLRAPCGTHGRVDGRSGTCARSATRVCMRDIPWQSLRQHTMCHSTNSKTVRGAYCPHHKSRTVRKWGGGGVWMELRLADILTAPICGWIAAGFVGGGGVKTWADTSAKSRSSAGLIELFNFAVEWWMGGGRAHKQRTTCTSGMFESIRS